MFYIARGWFIAFLSYTDFISILPFRAFAHNLVRTEKCTHAMEVLFS